MAQKDIKSRIASVKNIQKITRAMEMVAAARLRRAEQRIEALRPYAGAIRRMTRQASNAAENIPGLPILAEHEQIRRVGLMFVTGDRGLAGAFNSQILRAGLRAADEHGSQDREVRYYSSGKRGVSSLTFRGHELSGRYTGFTDRPVYANAREIAEDLMTAYVDGELDEVEIFYNGYISPLSQVVRRETLLPLQHEKTDLLQAEDRVAGGTGDDIDEHHRALVEYEPSPEAILSRLIPDYVEISVYRALLESTASEHGARMTAMRNASDNAGELIDDLTLEMNRARQAEITQEIMEVVAGAEALG
ncbi:MAG: ATP synthase F1 subunit gamma [Solirubrobacterales bacterium]